jgi:hypothetical protein
MARESQTIQSTLELISEGLLLSGLPLAQSFLWPLRGTELRREPRGTWVGVLLETIRGGQRLSLLVLTVNARRDFVSWRARGSMATVSSRMRHRCAISLPFLALSLGGSCTRGQQPVSLLAPLGGLRASHGSA